MSTITIPRGSASAKGIAALYGRPSKTLVTIVDLVNAAAVKGSAIAQDDVIQAAAIPGNSLIKSVYARVIEVADVATLNVHIGTGADNDAFVSGGDAVTLGLLAPTNIAQGVPQMQAAGTFSGFTTTFNYTATYDTIDVTLMTFTGTAPTTGQIAIYVDYVDLTTPQGANIADL